MRSYLSLFVRTQANEALKLANARTGKLGGWSREARDPETLRRSLDALARNTLVVVDELEQAASSQEPSA